ncbi:MAG: tRNA preQ1(34) S-adenosylmethionine ribosyltransferase-isomerase QueA [Peptococcaceae bacterium]|nr:tRNA preQ1(34) S-adenosylmethionine ribosyltransferase-isomerase QueA [Peptococcaceae bacterium]
MRLSDFDYELPDDLIAQEPLPYRDASRLMVIHRAQHHIEHKRFRDIVDYLDNGDLLVLNETKVLPVRLLGHKKGTGGRVEVLLLHPAGDDCWECLVRPGRRLRPGAIVVFGPGLEGEVIDYTESGGRIVRFRYEGSFEELLARMGQVPLPPYIKKPLQDRERYQTVYARKTGSAAAPTAGMHFTEDLIASLKSKGVQTATLTLHIGLDTFRPVKVEDITKHKMHKEYYEISEQTSELINKAKRDKRRVIAVGTTTTRCLEAAAGCDGFVRPGSGWTDLFIYPGYRFKIIDALLTNFHLPRSTLLMMVSAFASRDLIMHAYHVAVKEKYRFFSFGDAMLII